MTKKNQTLFYGIAFVLSLCFGLFFCTNSSVSALEDLSGTADYNYLLAHTSNRNRYFLPDVDYSLYNGGYLIVDISGYSHSDSYSHSAFKFTFNDIGSSAPLTFPVMNTIYIFPICSSGTDCINLRSYYNIYFDVQVAQLVNFENISIKYTVTMTRPNVGSCPECEECETCPPSTGGGGDYSGVIRAIYIFGASVVVCMFFYLILKMFMGVRR